MSQYRIRIINHTVMGYPYVPICKFNLTKYTKANQQQTQQSTYLNPPLYNPQLQQKQKSPAALTSDDSAYMKQFPVEFSFLAFRQSDEVEIKLIELTRTGREKQIGFSKITLNAEVLGKSTKHKIVQWDPQQSINPNDGKLTNAKYDHTISVVQIQVYQYKTESVSPNKSEKASQLSKTRNQGVNRFQLPHENDFNKQNGLSEEDSEKQHDEQEESFDTHNYNKQQNDDMENEKFVVNEYSREEANGSIQFKKNQTLEKVANQVYQTDMPNKEPLQSKQPQSPSRRRILVPSKPESQSKNSSRQLISQQSRLQPSNNLSGKIVRQKMFEKDVGAIKQTPTIQQTGFKHKRRLKYIFNTSEFGAVGQSLVEDQRTEGFRLKTVGKEDETLQKKDQLKDMKRIHTEANPSMPLQLVQYFISNFQTDQNGCNSLNSLYIVYESAFGPFRPRYITFLTYKLYERIIRINCEELNLNQHKKKSTLSPQKEKQRFILQTEEGMLHDPEVCDQFSGLKILLPKYCLMLRVEVILEDESVYVGTLANQFGMHIKSVLQLKRYAQMPNSQVKKQKERINLIVNISQDPTSKSTLTSKHQSPIDFIVPKNISTKNSSNIFLSPQKLSESHIEVFPQILRKHYNQQDQIEQNKGYVRLKDVKPKKQVSPIEKTLNAINSYKICLNSANGPSPNDQECEPIKKAQRKQYLNSHERYGPLKKDQSRKGQQLLVREQSPQDNRSNAFLQYSAAQNSQDNIAQILKYKKTMQKDLPKIMVHRSSNYNLIQSRKEALLQNLREQLTIKTRKMNRSPQNDQNNSKNKIRLEFFKKILGSKYANYQSDNSSSQKILTELSIQKKAHKSKTKTCLQEQLKEAKRRSKKLMSLPYADFSSTKMFPSSSSIKKNKQHMVKHVSCHEKCMKPLHHTKEVLKNKKSQMKSNASLNSLDQRSKSEQKKGGRYNVIVRKIEYLKLVEYGEHQKKMTRKFKSIPEDSDNERWEADSRQGKDKKDELQIFLKLFNESKKHPRQFVTESQQLTHAFPDESSSSQSRASSPLSLNYMTTCWSLYSKEFIFKNIKLSDIITVEAYSDLTSVDNHEFMGKCIFTVHEMFYMKMQRKITGYLIKRKKIESHCTLYFDIEEIAG